MGFRGRFLATDWLRLTTMGGTRLRIGRQSPCSSPRSRPPSSAPRERCGIQIPARAWAVRSAPPREVPAAKSQGLRGRGALGTRGWRARSLLPSCTGAPAAHPEGEAGTLTIWWGAGGVVVGSGRCSQVRGRGRSRGEWVLFSGKGHGFERQQWCLRWGPCWTS